MGENARREMVLREMGLRVVRFRNEEVVRDASRSAVESIREAVGK
jgi:very-short-patch-repair endonuclease